MIEPEIHPNQMPTRLPIIQTMVFALVFDRLNASLFAWGVVITLMAIMWVAAIYTMAKVKWVRLPLEKLEKYS